MTEQAIGDDVALAALRLAALGLADGTDWSRCADHVVVDTVNAARVGRRLAAAGQTEVSPTLFPLVPRRAAAPSSPATAGAAAPRIAAVAPVALPEATFDADLDVAAMVSALRQAAQDGVPFCEECARAAAARAAGRAQA